eukprot:gene14391-16983_t
MGEGSKKANRDLLFLDREGPSPSPLDIGAAPKKSNMPASRPNICKLPPSSVLSRVRDFLPKLKEANAHLEQQIAANEDVSIESVREGEQYIEMNLCQ